VVKEGGREGKGAAAQGRLPQNQKREERRAVKREY